MKPANAARRADFTFRPHDLAVLRALVQKHHYARGSANTAVLAMGMFEGERLVGAALWLPPTRVCAESVNPLAWRRVLSLSRLALVPGLPTNAASMLIGACLRHLRREKRWASLVTFADESQGHEGTIYYATNWSYVGRTRPEPRWEDASGMQVSRLSTKSRTAAEMRALGYRMVGRFCKHKFVMHLTSSSGYASAHGSPTDSPHRQGGAGAQDR